MSILIKGMEMPVFEHQSWDIRKGADGKWYMVDTNAETSDGEWHEIIPVPPHGRLIDADALIDAIIAKYIRHERHRELVFAVVQIKQDMADIINELPTIIPAEEGE